MVLAIRAQNQAQLIDDKIRKREIELDAAKSEIRVLREEAEMQKGVVSSIQQQLAESRSSVSALREAKMKLVKEKDDIERREAALVSVVYAWIVAVRKSVGRGLC